MSMNAKTSDDADERRRAGSGSRNWLPSVALIVSLDSSVIGNGSEPNLRIVTRFVGVRGGEAAEPAAGDLDVAVRDRVLDDRRRDDRAVEDDREVARRRCSAV